MEKSREDTVWEALRTVRFPGMSRDIVSFGFVRAVRLAGDRVEVELAITTQSPAAAEEVRQAAERAVAALPGVAGVEARLALAAVPSREESAQRAIAQNRELIPGVRNVIAVASGKGGVGKSTVAVNLAIALAREGHAVGILDADIYGPSIPMMFGIAEQPRVVDNRIQPFERYGVKVMSLGFILDLDTPVIWRGPMVMRAIEQMLGDVDWGELDFLVLDLPPGTGDAQLTVTQKIPLAGAVIVTTPQDVALTDARKGLAMFRKVNVPVIGVIENMSSFVCPHCGHETDIFKRGGGRRTAEELGCPFLGAIPLDPAIVEGGDSGRPIVVAQPQGAHAAAFAALARAVAVESERVTGERADIRIV
jgi:ATP-binding protein involved in chromosome partitioning